MKRFIILWIFLIFFLTVLLSGCSSDNTKDNPNIPQVGLSLGNVAPDFQIQMDDKITKLSELKGTPVFLNFWASWCPPCNQEMPAIQQIHEENFGVDIIAINVKEAPMHVRSFMESKNYNFPVGYDLNGEISSLYMATGIPTSYGIDADGIIRYQIQGPLSSAQLHEWFNTLEQTSKKGK